MAQPVLSAEVFDLSRRKHASLLLQRFWRCWRRLLWGDRWRQCAFEMGSAWLGLSSFGRLCLGVGVLWLDLLCWLRLLRKLQSRQLQHTRRFPASSRTDADSHTSAASSRTDADSHSSAASSHTDAVSHTSAASSRTNAAFHTAPARCHKCAASAASLNASTCKGRDAAGPASSSTQTGLCPSCCHTDTSSRGCRGQRGCTCVESASVRELSALVWETACVLELAALVWEAASAQEAVPVRLVAEPVTPPHKKRKLTESYYQWLVHRGGCGSTWKGRLKKFNQL